MPRIWPDPPDNDPEPPSKAREIAVYLAAALIGVGFVVNIARGLAGWGWNW